MNGFSIGKVVLAIAAIALCCQVATAAPRVKREDAADNDEFVLSPVGAVVSLDSFLIKLHIHYTQKYTSTLLSWVRVVWISHQSQRRLCARTTFGSLLVFSKPLSHRRLIATPSSPPGSGAAMVALRGGDRAVE